MMHFIFRSLALTVGFILTASLALATPTGHVPTSSLGYHDGTITGPDYSVNPTQRQSRSSSAAARSDLYHNENIDAFFNFEFDTSGYSVFVRYTTDGSAPTKATGSSATTGFEKFSSPDRWWYARFNGAASGTVIRYVLYANTTGGTLAAANRRMSPLGYQSSWTEGESGAYYEFTVHHNTTGAGGNWTTGGTWAAGAAPNACGNIATILSGATVTLNSDQTVGNLNVLTGGTFNNGSNKLSVCSGGTIARSGTFNGDTGTIAFLGVGTVSAATTFNNVEISGGFTPNGSTVNGNFTVQSGGFCNASPIYGSSSTLIYNNGGAYTPNQEWIGNATQPTAGGPHNVQINGGVSLAFTAFTNPRIATGSITINPTASLTLSGTSGGDLYVNGNFTNNGTFTHSGRAVRFQGAGAQAASGTLSMAFVRVFNTSNLTLNNDMNIANEIQMIAGTTLNFASGVDLILTNAVFNYDGGSVTFAGSNTIQLIDNSDLDIAVNLDLSSALVDLTGSGSVDIFGAGTRTFLNITTDLGVNFNLNSVINGVFTIEAGGFVDGGNPPTYGTGSTLRYDTGGTYAEDDEWTEDATSGAGVPYNVEVASGTTVDLQANSSSYTVRNTLTVSGTFDNANGGTLNIAGNLTGTGTFQPDNCTVVMNGAAAQTMSLASSPFNNLTIQNTHASDKVISASTTVNGNLTVADGIFNTASDFNNVSIAAAGTLELNGAATVSGNWANSGTFTPGTNTVTFDGATPSVTITGTSTFHNLTINKDSNSDTVDATSGSPVDVSNDLTITRGVFQGGDIDVTRDLTNSANGTLTQDAEIRVARHFNNSGTYNAAGQALTFNGATTQNLTANVATALATLNVGVGTILTEIVAANNASAATLNNLGTIRKAVPVATVGNYALGLTGTSFNYSAYSGGPTLLSIDRIAGAAPNATAPIAASGEYFDIVHTIPPSSFTTSVTLPHSGADPFVARYVGPGTVWNTARDSFTASTVTRNGVSAYSIWAVSLGAFAPEVDLNGAVAGNDNTAAFTEGSPSVNITTADATVTDSDSANLTTGTVTITNLLDGTDEALQFDTSGTSIVGNYNTGSGVLTLTGPDTVANFQTVLRTVKYNNTNISPNTTSRVVQVLMHDSDLTSIVRTATVSVTSVNSVPSLATNTGISLARAASEVINTAELETTDADHGPGNLTYTVTVAPANGTVRDGVTPVSTFTQADINAGDINYLHNGGSSTSDSFQFTVSDGVDTIGPFTCNITITAPLAVPDWTAHR